MNEWRRSGSGKCALTDLVWVLAAAAGADPTLAVTSRCRECQLTPKSVVGIYLNIQEQDAAVPECLGPINRLVEICGLFIWKAGPKIGGLGRVIPIQRENGAKEFSHRIAPLAPSVDHALNAIRQHDL
jgi:hypothetical protein